MDPQTSTAPPVPEATDVQVDLARRVVTRADGEDVRLTSREAALLEYLMARVGQTVAREELQEEVLGISPLSLSRAVDSAIARLRGKIETDRNQPRHLLTDHGEGYRWVASGPAPARTAPSPAPADRIDLGPLSLDFASSIARIEGNELVLTAIERRLLRALAERAGTFIDRQALRRKVWPDGAGSRALPTLVHRLRKKLGDGPDGEPWIQTGRSKGVRLQRPPPPTLPDVGARRVFGRDAEVEALRGALGRGERLVSLLGPPGIGKTTVMRTFAARSVPPGRRPCWVDLGITTTVEGLCGAVAQGMLLDAPGAELRAHVRRALAADPSLIVLLDNAEHLDDDARAEIAAWVEAGTTVVATSLEPLHLTGEVRVVIGPLAATGDGGTDDTDADAADERDPALLLFESVARRVKPGFNLDEQTRPAALRIVAALDRWPLAIDLAATRVDAMGLADIESQLNERFSLLEAGRADVPERHRTLFTAIASQWTRLQPDERAALATLSVWVAPFSLADADAVLPDAAVVPRLVRRNLLTVQSGRRGRSRFSLYSSIRAFAQLQLHELGLAEEAHAAFSRWARDTAATLIADRRPPDDMSGPLPRVLDNLLAAARIDGPTAIAVARAVSDTLAIRGQVHAWAELLERALAGAESDADRAFLLAQRAMRGMRIGADQEQVRADAEAVLELAASGQAAFLAHTALGSMAIRRGDPSVAERHYRAAREDALSRGDRRSAAAATNNLGLALRHLERPDEAAACYEDALEGLESDASRAVVHLNLGVIQSTLGRASRALEEADRAVALLRDGGHPAHRIKALGLRGEVYRQLGRPEDAERVLRETLVQAEQVHGTEVGLTRRRLAALELERADPDATIAEVEAALRALPEDMRPVRAYLWAYRGAARAMRAELAGAERDLARARRAFEEVGDHIGTRAVAIYRLLLDGDPEQAEALVDDPRLEVQLARRAVQAHLAGAGCDPA